jgi:isocitrate lyase
MKNVNVDKEKRFGKLTVKKRVAPPEFRNPHYSYWECVCDCGKIKIAKAKNLVNGDCVSCGCKRKSRYEEIPGSYFGAMKQRVRAKKLEYNISPEYMWDLYLSQNKKCALTGMDIGFDPDYRHGKQSASLDRIDSARGYIVGNVRWVHKKINQIKMDMTDVDFIDLCHKVVCHAGK